MKVKHKEERFRPSTFNTLKQTAFFYWAKLMGQKDVIVDIEFSTASIYWSEDQNDWLKVFGSKSGFNTATNEELIIAYRCVNADFQTCIYIRNHDNIKWHSVKHPKFGQRVRYRIPLAYAFPAISWAGGNHAPMNDFEYKLALS